MAGADGAYERPLTAEEAARQYSIPEGQRAAAEFLKGLPGGQPVPHGLVDLFELIYREAARAGFIAGAVFVFEAGKREPGKDSTR